MRANSVAAAACVLAVSALGVGCGDGSTRACFGSIQFCEDSFRRNLAPEARTGPDREVEAGERVQLDGTGSFDRDGHIASYSWTQKAGPSVALEGAAQAVAEFIAPAVAEETFLDFRLVVTDDDRASDSEGIRITVLPAVAVALRQGVRRLKQVDPMAVTEPGLSGGGARPAGQLRAGALGAWLAARVRAAAAGAEPELDTLLDELRVIELLQVEASLAHASGPERRLLRLAQREVAAFTRERDPGTSELARQQQGAGAPGTAAEWQSALLAAYPELDWLDASPALVRARARELLRVPDMPLELHAAAAATLLLATTPP